MYKYIYIFWNQGYRNCMVSCVHDEQHVCVFMHVSAGARVQGSLHSCAGF